LLLLVRIRAGKTDRVPGIPPENLKGFRVGMMVWCLHGDKEQSGMAIGFRHAEGEIKVANRADLLCRSFSDIPSKVGGDREGEVGVW
jgi:hypothetical protein